MFISPLLFSSLLFHLLSLHLVSSHVLLLLSSCPLSFLLSIFSSLVFNLLFHLHVSLLSSFIFSCLFSSLLFHLLVSPFSSSRLFSFLVLSSLSFLVLSLLLCLSLSLSVSLCLSLFLSVSVSVSLCLRVVLCVVVLCGVVCVVWCVARLGTQKKPSCVRSKLRVYVQNVSVCAGTTPACVTTCGLGAGTHGDVLNLHTEVFGTDTRRRGGGKGGRGEEGSPSVLLTMRRPT